MSKHCIFTSILMQCQILSSLPCCWYLLYDMWNLSNIFLRLAFSPAGTMASLLHGTHIKKDAQQRTLRIGSNYPISLQGIGSWDPRLLACRLLSVPLEPKLRHLCESPHNYCILSSKLQGDNGETEGFLPAEAFDQVENYADQDMTACCSVVHIVAFLPAKEPLLCMKTKDQWLNFNILRSQASSFVCRSSHQSRSLNLLWIPYSPCIDGLIVKVWSCEAMKQVCCWNCSWVFI